MTNRELEIFLTVVECGKMTETARRLYITQSSVSQAIANIEKEYGVKLFERLSNSLYLTAVGKQLAIHGKNYFAVKNDMDNFLDNVSKCRKIRVGASVTVGTCVISPILKKMKERFQDIEIEAEIANTYILEELLLKNEIDIALIEGKISNPELLSEDLIEDRLVLVCAPEHRFSARTVVKAKELEGESFIMREQGSGTRKQFEDEMRAKNIPLTVRWNCCNSEAIKNAVRDGHGISVISERLVREETRQGLLCMAEIEDIELKRYFSVVYHRRKFLSEELLEFISRCRAFGAAEKGSL